MPCTVMKVRPVYTSLDIMEWISRLRPVIALLLMLSASAQVNGDAQIGYYIPSGQTEALVASCDVLSTASERWSSVGSIGVCVETSASSDSDIMTTGYYRGETCNGTSAQGFYVGSADTRTASVTVSFGCRRSCATITVFAASPSASPSLSFIGCPEQIGLPPEARTVYVELPSGITAAPGSAARSSSAGRSTSGTSSPTQTTNETRSSTTEPSQSPTFSTEGGGPNTSVIVGAVVGSVGGIGPILLAFVLGQRYAAKKRVADTTQQPPQPYEGKPELAGTAVGTGVYDATPKPMAWSQAGWGQQQQQQPQELWSNHPAAHQLAAERGPYEVPGSQGYFYQLGTQLGQQPYGPPHTRQ